MTVRYEIIGGAGPYEAAAIAAAIAAVISEQIEAAATPPQRPRQSPWVVAGRPGLSEERVEGWILDEGVEPTGLS